MTSITMFDKYNQYFFNKIFCHCQRGFHTVSMSNINYTMKIYYSLNITFFIVVFTNNPPRKFGMFFRPSFFVSVSMCVSEYLSWYSSGPRGLFFPPYKWLFPFEFQGDETCSKKATAMLHWPVHKCLISRKKRDLSLRFYGDRCHMILSWWLVGEGGGFPNNCNYMFKNIPRNFVFSRPWNMLVVPSGQNHKRLQSETGCRIEIRGLGVGRIIRPGMDKKN